VLSQIDRALTGAGHRSIVLAAEGSRTTGEIIRTPACSRLIGRTEWAAAHEFLRTMIDRVVVERRADLVHMHGVDFQSYLPSPGVTVLATLHLPQAFYPCGTLQLARPRTWLNTVSRYQHETIGPHPRIVGHIENGVVCRSPPPAHKDTFALAMGRICPEKGFHIALDAARAADFPLQLAGTVSNFPEHREYFKNQIRPRLDHSRRWIGAVSGDVKWEILQSAQCLLVPSLVPETASLVAREAMAAGTPVIAFPSGALCETVEDGRLGFLVNNAAEMAKAFFRAGEIDPVVCQQVANERYSAARMSEQYLALYQELAKADQCCPH
jgi:glycosyltransferase involved in cell wall biosynthesis